jgi:nicotinamidase/pyrazinamidase
MKVRLAAGDALLLVDVQNDFLPGGSLPVPHGEKIIPTLNRYIAFFHAHDLPIFATRDWHPRNHCSFLQRGGRWPPHCIAETAGAAFPASLELPPHVHIISKAISSEKDAYSGFDDTHLYNLLHSSGIHRLLVGGLATEYCVLNTVKDALQYGYSTFVLKDAVHAISITDGLKALEEMERLGAVPIHYEMLVRESDFQPPAD